MRSVATPDDTPVGQSVTRDTSHPWTGTPMSQFSDQTTTVPSDDFSGPGSLRVEDQPFALVPEWVIDTDISDAAFRVYSLLLRYGNTSGQRMPSRKLLAVRLHRSVDAVDRAVRELADTGLVRIEHRRAGRRNLTNRYHLTTRDPDVNTATGGGRGSAPTPSATPQVDPDAQADEGRGSAGSRTSAATPDSVWWPRFCGEGGRRSAARPREEDPRTSSPQPPADAAGWIVAVAGGGRPRPLRHHRPRRPGRTLPPRPAGTGQADRAVDPPHPDCGDPARPHPRLATTPSSSRRC